MPFWNEKRNNHAHPICDERVVVKRKSVVFRSVSQFLSSSNAKVHAQTVLLFGGGVDTERRLVPSSSVFDDDDDEKRCDGIVVVIIKKVTVVDARNPDFSMEPGDEQFGGPGKQFPIENCGTRGRPNAINLPFSREKKEVSGFDGSALHDAEKDAPIITHCGGGGRGQKSKEWLEKKGFTNVINGGGPQVTELWEMFGDL